MKHNASVSHRLLMTNEVKSASLSVMKPSVDRARRASGRLLIAANAPEMFRDFLNPFGQHFRRQGWKVDAMARDLRKSGECDGNFDGLLDVNWSRSPWDLENLLQAPRMFREAVETSGYDLIHVHTPIPAFISRCAIARVDLRDRPLVVYTAHGFHFHDCGSGLKNQLFLRLEKLAGRWTDCLVVINRADEEAARRHRLVPDQKILYMPGIGIERRDYDPASVSETAVAQFRREIQVSVEAPLILMLAEFSPGKRHSDALRAFARMRHNESRLLLAGEGSLRSEMMLLAQQLGIAQRVHFLGFRRDVPVLLRSATLSILPSEREGLPKSIMEALNMGIPVVGTNVRGIRDLLVDGAGKLVPLGSIESLAEAMDWIMDHPAESKKMGQTGQSQMYTYERDHIFKLHEDLYANLLDRRHRN